MVHALREIHRLLRRDGCLIEIHPAVGAPTVEVRQDRHLSFVEHDPGYDYEDDLRSAEDAVDRVIEAGVFMVDRTASSSSAPTAPPSPSCAITSRSRARTTRTRRMRTYWRCRPICTVVSSRSCGRPTARRRSSTARQRG